jgi:ABC-2 type transport system permease protein
MMLVAPLLLAGAIGAAFGSGDSFSIPEVKVVVVDQDGGAGAGLPAAGAALTGALSSPELAGLLAVTSANTPEEARAAVDSGDADVAVVIPPGLSLALMGAAGPAGPAGGTAPVAVEIYKDPVLTVGPAIVATVVEQVLTTFEGARAAAGSAAQAAAAGGLTDPSALSQVAARAAQEFAGRAQGEPAIGLAARAPATPGAGVDESPNVAGQVLVGMMLFFMLFGASLPARSIIDEHRAGTLPRLFTTPTPRSAILGGKYIAVFLVVLLQSVILIVAGRFLLGARWGEVGPVIVLTLCGALVAASLGLLTVSFAKTPAQAGAVSAAIFVFIGLISGNFTGTADIGGAFGAVRRVSPLGWLLEAWNDVMFGGSWDSIALPVLAVLGFTLLFFAVATLFFRRRYA